MQKVTTLRHLTVRCICSSQVGTATLRAIQAFLTLVILAAPSVWAAQNTTALASTNTSTLKNEKKDTHIEYYVSLGGSQYQSDVTQASQASTRLEMTLQYKPLNWLRLNITPAANFESGAQQNFSPTPADQNNKILLKKATVDFQPVSWSTLSLGIQDLRENHESILFDYRAFAGARASLAYPLTKEQTLHFFAETLIPSSSSLSTEKTDLEKTPGFDSVGAGFEVKLSPRSFHIARLSYFQFRDLPKALAQQSGVIGNRVDSISEVESRFLNNYQGTEMSGETNWFVAKNFDIGFRGQYVINNGASDENQAYLFGAQGMYYLNSKSRVGLAGYNYKIDADAVVAAYSSRSLGYTNRNGYGASLFYEWLNPSVKVSFGMNESDVIFESPSQYRENFYTLKVEVKNVAF